MTRDAIPMRGNTGLRNAVSVYVQSVLPPQIAYYREQYGLSPAQLADFVSYDVVDPYDVIKYPAFGAYFTGHTAFKHLEHFPDGSQEYSYTCEATLFVAARTAYLGVDEQGIDVYEEPYRESAVRQRDDYMALLREAVFRDPAMGTYTGDMRIITKIDSWRESYPEPFKVSDQRNPYWVANAVAVVDMTVIERTADEYIGKVVGTNAKLDKRI